MNERIPERWAEHASRMERTEDGVPLQQQAGPRRPQGGMTVIGNACGWSIPVWEDVVYELGASAALVFGIVQQYTINGREHACYLSVDGYRLRTGLSGNSIRTALTRLTESGLIVHVGQHPTLYTNVYALDREGCEAFFKRVQAERMREDAIRELAYHRQAEEIRRATGFGSRGEELEK